MEGQVADAGLKMGRLTNNSANWIKHTHTPERNRLVKYVRQSFISTGNWQHKFLSSKPAYWTRCIRRLVIGVPRLKLRCLVCVLFETKLHRLQHHNIDYSERRKGGVELHQSLTLICHNQHCLHGKFCLNSGYLSRQSFVCHLFACLFSYDYLRSISFYSLIPSTS